jgi:hypothetical protein
LTDVVDIAAARTARAEATVNAELARLNKPFNNDEKWQIAAAVITTLQAAVLELFAGVEALEKKDLST